MKTFAIILVIAVAGYAIWELFSGNTGLGSLFGKPGQITATGASVPGQPVYSNVAAPSNSQALLGLAAATVPTAVADAFGPSGNQLSTDEDDSTDATSLLTGDEYSSD